jgi:exo-beta-1,3-glucanase (GH17 family)
MMEPLRRAAEVFIVLSLLLVALFSGHRGVAAAELRPFIPLESEVSPPAVCYGPHRDGQRPGGPDPTAAQLTEDLLLMADHWKLLRVYGSGGIAATLLSIIRDTQIDMKVMLGVWIAPDDSVANQREVDSAIHLANAFPEIVAAVSVGNETQIFWSAHRSSVETLIECVRSVRAGVTVPVTVADDFNFWNKPESLPVAAEIDFVTMHAHPMWNGMQVDEALPWLQEQLEVVRAMHPEQTVVIGETGWATSVHDEGEQAELIKGQPGEAQQKQYYDAVRDWAQSERQVVFFFEAFDENWKGGDHPAEVEKHWGVFRADRTEKAAVESPAPATRTPDGG